MSDLTGVRVLVTGAGGFIGSHLAEKLVRSGAAVRALAKYNGRGEVGKLSEVEPEVFGEIDVRLGDIRDPFFVDKCVEGCDVVMHLAALIGIPYSYVAPADYVATNVSGTLNVLEACRRHSVQRLLQTSTSEVYGTAVQTPMPETHRLHPQSPYAASKVASDSLALSFYRSFETPVVVVRPFNTFGPRQSTRAVIPTILNQLLTTRDLKLGSTHPLRDFTFVTDTAQGFIDLAIAANVAGQTFNLGSGRSISMGELAQLCMEVTNERREIQTESDRLRPAESEVDRLESDPRAVQQATGWRPLVSLRRGLELTAAYLRQHPPAAAPGYSI